MQKRVKIPDSRGYNSQFDFEIPAAASGNACMVEGVHGMTGKSVLLRRLEC